MVQALATAVPTGGVTTSAQVTPKPKSETAAPKLNAVESAIVQQTNTVRARYGRRPLAVDFRLLNSARRHARWMTRHRTLRHTSATVAENIAMGQRSTSQVMRDWMNSSGHRANILNSSYRRIGVAAYRTPDGTIYWCQQFLR